MEENSLFELMVAPWKTRVVFTAVELDIFTLLSNKALHVEELASQCGADPELLKFLLDALVSMDLLHYRDNGYLNTEFSQNYLVEGHPQYIGDLLQLQADESHHWEKLTDIIRGSRKRRSEHDRYRTFIKAMDNLGMLGEAQALTDCLDLSGCKLMIDAGGGSGLYSVVLCQKYPELYSTILDRKETLEVTRQMISPYLESKRISLREADITVESFGHNIDIILLSDVIYEKGTAQTILENARKCLGDNGTLVIRGYYSDPENGRPLFGALFALGQLVFDPDREVMTMTSLEESVLAAGFIIKKMSSLTERSFIIEAKKKG